MTHSATGGFLNAFGHDLHSIEENTEGAEDFENGDNGGPKVHGEMMC